MQIKHAWEGRAVVVLVTYIDVARLKGLCRCIVGNLVIDLRHICSQVPDVLVVVKIGHFIDRGSVWLIHIHFLVYTVC